MWERDWVRNPQAGNTCSTLFPTPATSCPLLFSSQSLWNETQCSTLTQRMALSCLHMNNDHAHNTKELKLKLCKDTAPSSHSHSSPEGDNKTLRNFPHQPIPLQLPSLWSHFFLSHRILCDSSSFLPHSGQSSQALPNGQTHLQFIYSLKSHLWHQTHSLISFPALRTHLPSHLKCKAKAQPMRDSTAIFF